MGWIRRLVFAKFSRIGVELLLALCRLIPTTQRMIVVACPRLRGGRVFLEVADQHQADVLAQAVGAGGVGEAVMPEARVPGPVIKLHWLPRCGDGNQCLLYGLGAHVAPWAKRAKVGGFLGKIALGSSKKRKELVVAGGPEREAAAGERAILE